MDSRSFVQLFGVVTLVIIIFLLGLHFMSTVRSFVKSLMQSTKKIHFLKHHKDLSEFTKKTTNTVFFLNSYEHIIYMLRLLAGYGLGIGLRAAIMARGRRPRVIIAALRSVPMPYHYKQTLTYLLIGF